MSKFKGGKMSKQKKYNSGIKGIEKKNSFTVPDGYFENLSSRVQSRLLQENESPRVQTWERNIFRSKLALAASFIGLIIITYAGIRYLSVESGSPEPEAIEIADVINYQINDFEEDMIYNLYAETNMENADQDESGNEKIINAMVEYLLVENVDIQLIAQEL